MSASRELEAEAVFSARRIPFTEATCGQTAENAKDGRFGKPDRLHDLGEAHRRPGVIEHRQNVDRPLEYLD
jgi:hypothetical protein